nr:putative reverse transcriptase domain-containing protein [Tanacetum cinerariifolium]
MRQRRWTELFRDYDCEIRCHLKKANVAANALSKKERVKPVRVRVISMTIQSSVKDKILVAQCEASKVENAPAEMLRSVRTLIIDKAHASRYSVHPAADKTYYDLKDIVESIRDTTRYEYGYGRVVTKGTFSKWLHWDSMGEGSVTLTEPHHTPSPQEQHSPHHDPSSPSHPNTTTEPIPQTPTETPTLRRYTRRAIRIAQSKALSPAAAEPASLLRDDRQEEAFPTVSSLDAGHDRENINKTYALSYGSSPRVTSLDADEGNMQQSLQELIDLCTSLQRKQTQMAAKIKDQDLEISGLKARVKFLEDKDRGSAEPTQEDAPIKGGIMKKGEEVRADKIIELWSNDTDDMVNVLSSMEAANILTSRVAAVSVSHVAGVSTKGVPTVGGLFPTASVIFTTASMETPYTRRSRGILAKDKGKEKVVESERVSEQLVRDSEIARLHAEEELKMMIEGSAEQTTLKEGAKGVLYVCPQKPYAGWKTRHFRGMTLEEIKEKFIPVWKQLEDFVPMSSKEEGERVKRQGLKIDQGSYKRMKTFEDVSAEDLKGMMQLVPLEEVYVEALQVKNPIIDWEIHSKEKREEDLHQLWTLVKETLSIKQATKDNEKELWVELKRLFEPNF